MAFPTATLVYKVPVRGAGTVAQVQAAVADVLVPFDELTALGVRVTSDNTTSADPVVRTIVLTMEPDAVATATSTLTNDGSSIAAVTVTGAGAGYVVPPVPFFEGPAEIHAQAQAYLKLVGLSLVSGGTGYSASSTLNFIGGLSPGSAHQDPNTANITQRTRDPVVGPNCVGSVAVAKGGRGYLGTDTVQFLGSCTRPARGVPIVDAVGRITAIGMVDMGAGYVVAPDVVVTRVTGGVNGPAGNGQATLGACMQRGRAAVGSLTIGGGGTITGVAIADAGDGYVGLPQVALFDPTGGGSGGVILPSFGVGRIDVTQPGYGYTSPSGIEMFSRYESIFALALENDSPAALASTLHPFVNLMTAAIQSAVATPVSVSLPT